MSKEIKLTKGFTAIVDDEDFEYLNQWKWQAEKSKRGCYYACRTIQKENKKIHVKMHRLIMAAVEGMDVDHRDGNGLNNRRYNLRACTHLNNCHNRRHLRRENISGISGVQWDNRRGKWRSRIIVERKEIHLGRFSSLSEAINARREAEILHYGKYSSQAEQ
jgi:hypothetical protein